MTQVKAVYGNRYGSLWYLLLAGVVPLSCILIPAAIAGAMKWTVPVFCTAVWIVSGPFIFRDSAIVVTDHGFSTAQSGWKIVVAWTNVESIRAGRLGASVVLKEAQRFGLFKRRRIRFASLDPLWRGRATSVAILLHHGPSPVRRA